MMLTTWTERPAYDLWLDRLRARFVPSAARSPERTGVLTVCNYSVDLRPEHVGPLRREGWSALQALVPALDVDRAGIAVRYRDLVELDIDRDRGRLAPAFAELIRDMSVRALRIHVDLGSAPPARHRREWDVLLWLHNVSHAAIELAGQDLVGIVQGAAQAVGWADQESFDTALVLLAQRVGFETPVYLGRT